MIPALFGGERVNRTAHKYLRSNRRGHHGLQHSHRLFDVEGRKARSPVSIVDQLDPTQANLRLVPGVGGALALVIVHE